MKRVYPKEENCMNCRLCEVACIVEHSDSKDPLGAYFVEGMGFNSAASEGIIDPADALEAGKPKPLNRINVSLRGYSSISTNCRHCSDASCVLACKNGSLYYDDEGRVRLREDKCVGCWMCLMACEFGAITRNPAAKNVPKVRKNGINHHCDLCPERSSPACVMVCPTGALVYEERV